MMRKPGWIGAAAASFVVASSVCLEAQQAPLPPLTRLRFDIIGVRLVVDPPALTVPKNLATQINTSLVLPPGIGDEARDAILALTDGAQVEAELRGPSLPPTRIAVVPGKPIPIPPLAIPGDYFLDGIRLEKGGQTVLDATTSDGRPASTIPIRVINEVLVASVTSKPLSLDDIRSKGIVIDEKNFSAVNFQVAFNIDGKPFTINAPAVLPTPELLKTAPDRQVLVQQISAMNRTLSAALTTLPPEFDRPGLNFSIAALPFFPVDDAGSDPGFTTPPITGLIVIPGNVAFLNQFFSAMLLVANVAPDGTPLVLQDVSGTVTLPTGADHVAGTFDQPGDDPLRLARVDGAGVQPTVPVAQRGPDGKLGTADDVFVIPPQKQGEGEFLIEGLKEGSSQFDIAITATLVGLPSGPVVLQGQAAGAVFVRNPTFAVTLAHPRRVLSGEPYSVYATVTNTSKTPANLVSVNLDPHSITGAQLLSDPTVTFDSIPPGQSAVAKYSLRAQLTGEVTFASFTGDAALGGGIRLETGVDERGVALSANAIVLPQSTDALPASLVAAAQRVLGQAFSVATAPAEALPDGVLFVKRQTVIDRGIELAEAGERVQFGEPLSRVVQDLLLDWLGNASFDEGFDQILRETDAGSALLSEFAAIVAPQAVGGQALDYQRQFAQTTAARDGHLSAIGAAEGGTAAPTMTITRASGGGVGEVEGVPTSSLESGALLELSANSSAASLAIVARPETDHYTIEIDAPASGLYDLGVVVPVGPGDLRQFRFAGIPLDAGGRAQVEVDVPAGSGATLSIDRDGNGVSDGTAAADLVDVTAGPPQLVAARQLASSTLDPGSASDPATYGLLVGALFDAPVTQVSAELKSNYSIDSNAVIGTQLQHNGRLVYLYLQKPIGGLTPRSLTVNGVADSRGNVLPNQTQPIVMSLTDGAHVFGQVRDAGGAGVGGGILELTISSVNGSSFNVAAIRTDGSGGFDFDFVPRVGTFTITAQHPVTSDLATISARIRGAGEQLLVNPTFLGRGTVRGRVIGPDGATPVANILVALIPGSVLGTSGFQARTNALGEFTFTEVPVGVFTLSAADGAGAFGQATGLIARGGDAISQDLGLVTQPQEDGRLLGRVFQSDGATPAAGFTVYVGTYHRDDGTIAAVDQTETDATGSFAFSRTLPPAGYDVVAVDPASGQLGAAHADVVARTTSSVSIVLEAVGTVEGVVFNGRGEPVKGAVVAGGVALVTTDANGLFRIDGVPAGTKTIEAGDPVTRRRGSADVTVLPGQTVSASITLESRATITGRVLDANGNPVPGASVRIPHIGGFDFVIANNQGVFTFPDLPLGDYLIEAPGPSKESLISFMQSNGIDPRTAFTSGDAPDGAGDPTIPPPASDQNAVLAAYQQAVQTFFSVPDSVLDALPMAPLGGFGWNKVSLFQDAATIVADVKFLPQGTVSGRTLDAAGNPTGAVVRVSSLRVTNTGAPGFGELSRVNTDPATGAFSFGGIARFDLATFQTAAVRAGDLTLEAANPFSPIHPQFRGQLSTATPDLADVVLQFPAAGDTNGTISGRVFQPDGVTPAPAGTQVAIGFGDLAVTTDADGTFRSLLPIPAGTYTVTARQPNGLRGQTMAVVPAGGNVDVQMRVLGLGVVTVTVKRSNGTPVGNAAVSLLRGSFPADRAQGTTDQNGVARFVNISEGPFSVEVQEAVTGLGGRASGNILRDGDLAVPVVLAASGVVTGTFLPATGTTPIAFAQIALASNGLQAYASTDANGRFAFAAIPVGPFTLDGFDPATNRRGRATGTLQFEGQAVDVTILEAPRGTVTGVVVTADGVTPVPAARVSLRGSSFVETALQATALADGSFRFDGVPAGTFTLEATDPVSGFSGAAKGQIAFEGDTAAVNVPLAPFGSIHATVFAVDGQPVPNASVSAAGRQAAVDTNGEFTFEHLALGSYQVVARSLADSNDGGDATVKLDAPNQVAEAAIHLRGVGSVAATVVSSSGTGTVAGAKVTLQALGASGTTRPGPLATTLTAFTDAQGIATFPSVPVGDFSVRAEAAALAGIGNGTIAAAGASVAVQVQLGASGTVAGRVLLSDGVTAAAGAFVTLRFQSQSTLQTGVLQVTTDLTGAFEFAGIPLGPFSVSAIEVVTSGVRSASGTIAGGGQRVDLGTLILDNAAPRVVDVTPADRSGNVDARSPIVVTFSEPIDANAISTAVGGNVALLEGSSPVPLGAAEFSGDGLTLTLRPTRDLASGALETLTIRGAPDGPKDLSGFTMLDPVLSTFTVRDSVPPTVVSVSPPAGAVQVGPDAVVRVTFSEPVLGATVTIHDDTNAPIAGTITLAGGGTVAIFTPTDFLRTNAGYTVTVSNVSDTAGNPLVGGGFSSAFATVDTIAPVIANVEVVGTPRAGASITLHPTIAAADVQRVEFTLGEAAPAVALQSPFDAALALPSGVPAATVTAVAFDQVGNRSNPFQLTVAIQPNQPPVVTLTNVAGATTVGQGQTLAFQVHATDDDPLAKIFFSAVGAVAVSQVQAAAPGQTDFSQQFSITIPAGAPSNSTITVQAAATDSAGGQSVPAAITLNVRDAARPTVAVQSPADNSLVLAGQNVDVVVDAADDVALSSVALVCNPALAGCESRAIAPGVASSHQTFTVVLPPSLQAPQTVTLSIVATDTSGNTGTASRILRLADTVSPTITALESATGSTRVVPGGTATLRATVADNVGVTALEFSTQGAVTTNGVSPVAPAVVSGQAVLSIPIPADAPNGQTVTVGVRARDAVNNASEPASLTLTVGDSAAPILTVLEPADGTTAAPGGSVTVRVSATDDVGVARFTLTASGAFSFSDGRDISPATTPAAATFVVPVPAGAPAGPFTLTLAAIDTSGNPSAPVARALSVTDVVAPQVQVVAPAQDAALDPRNPVAVTVTATDAVGVTAIDFGASGSVSASDTRSVQPAATSRTEIFTVNVTPIPAAGGTLTLNATARDAAGNNGTAPPVTIRLTDVVAPDVVSTAPAGGATGVDPQTAIVARFSEPMNPATLNAASIQLQRAGAAVPASLAVSGNDDVVTLTPTAQPLAPNATFTLIVTTAATDRAGNPLAAVRTFTFTTASPDTTPPTVASIVPADGSAGVSLATSITVTFSEAIDPSTVTAQSFAVHSGTTPIDGTFSFLNGNSAAQFTPAAPLPSDADVTTALTSGITDLFGNALAAADGSPLTSPLTFTFHTGQFSLTSPAGPDVVENSTVVLEARASASLGATSVVFTVNGAARPAVSGPPFTTTLAVGSAASTPTLDIVASARNAGGTEIARDERTVDVVVGLKVAPTFTGAPLGGTLALTFSVSSALPDDLPIALAAGDPAIVAFPANPVILPAGQTKVDATIAGLATGATAVIGSSSHGTAAAIVAVSPVQPGQTLTPASAPVGASLSNAPSGIVVARAGTGQTVHLDLLGAPATADTPVSVVSTNTAVATATATTIATGQTATDVQITPVADGVATIVVRVGDDVRSLTVFVGTLPANLLPLITARPAGLAISNAPGAGQLVASAGRQITVSVPLLTAPAGADAVVTVSSDNPAVATAAAAPIPAGQTAATVTVTTVADGIATLTLRAGADVRALKLFVGTLPPNVTPILTAKPVGLSLASLPSLGRLFAPLGASRTIGVRLFDSPAASDIIVTATTSDPNVANVVGPVVVHAGEQIANIELATGSGGTATLTIEAAGVRREMTLVVGGNPTPATTPPVVAAPAGVTVVPNPSIGSVFGQLGTPSAATLGIPLLGAPAAAVVSVTVTSSNPSIVAVGGGATTTITIGAGEQVLQLPIDISGTEGAALLTIESGGERRELLVVVGNPPASAIPAVTAPIVGVRIG
ncbi:MAG: Ig-like domain-containing protein [Betaproteobacteria bacterium]